MTHPQKTPLIEGAWSREGLEDLLARVEGAEGADREIDARLYVLLIGRLRNPAIEDMIAQRAASHPGKNVWLSGAKDWEVKPYTASLDAALALKARVLPGWTVATISEQDDKTWFAELRDGYLTSYSRVAISSAFCGQKRPKTPALALLAALLRALIAQAETPLPTRIDEEN